MPPRLPRPSPATATRAAGLLVAALALAEAAPASSADRAGGAIGPGRAVTGSGPAIETAAAGRPGYYVCDDGTWVAEGSPAYPPPPRARNGGTAPATIRSEAACVARGGSWRAVGIFPQKICVLPTADAGRVCGDDGECEASCVAELTQAERDLLVRKHQAIATTGKCSPAIPIVGCHAIVHEGEARGITCFD